MSFCRLSLILVRRAAFPLLFLGAGLMLVQPCAGGAFFNTGSLNTARESHTATLLPNGMVLVAGGFNNGFVSVASAELYDPANGTWTVTGSLATARGGHTATLLPNGKVLVAGGVDLSNALSSAELYDPASGTWSATGSMGMARYDHTATLLPNGLVLVAGGGGDSAELYDPANGTWSNTGRLKKKRLFHTATLLPNGKVLVAGGQASAIVTAITELYDPSNGIWSDTGSLNTARFEHTATLLPNGMVLVAGGKDGNYDNSASAELYDPANGIWSGTGNLNTRRYFHTATLLPNDMVLVAGGGNGGGVSASAELYDPATGTWSDTASLNSARYFHTATLLPNGMVLVAGGSDSSNNFLASAELYDLATPPAKLLNISTRVDVETGDNVAIGGFIIIGNGVQTPKTVVIRAIGPSLANAVTPVTGTLADPVLELHEPDGTVVTNNDWMSNSAADQANIIAKGLDMFMGSPISNLESIIVATLPPVDASVPGSGAYTAIIRGNGTDTGVGLVEVYDIDDPAVPSELANISTRGIVGTVDNVLIGGLIVGPSGGTELGNATVVVRAIGPSLTTAGVAGALQDPTLELHDSNGAIIASNDNWMESPDKHTIIDNGLAPSNDRESALFGLLAPGAYTAIVSGVQDTTGVALVEAYNLQ